MLTFFRRPLPPHSYRIVQTRSLQSLPREIPTYLKRWDPTLHRSRESALRLEDSSWLIAQNDTDSPSLRESIRKVNLLLRCASKDPDADAELHEPMLNAYSRAGQLDPLIKDRISDQASSILSRIQSLDPPSFLGRSDDYSSEDDWLAYLENLMVQGKELKAAVIWDADHFHLRERQVPNTQNYHTKFLDIGVKIHAYGGNLLRARRVMHELYDMYPDWDTAAMMIVFRAHTSSAKPKDHEYARTIRSKMKGLKAEQLSLEDYDGWFVGFLEAKHLKYAQKVFREMIKDGFLGKESAEDVGEVLKRIHMLYRLVSDPELVSRVALDTISVLPRAYHTYIYGDWMKFAVVQRAPKASLEILESMMEQGYHPETFHLNMLLKAMMRTKESQFVLKAENIAWNMVEATRKTTMTGKAPDRLPEQIHKRMLDAEFVESYVGGKSTAANTATFALLMQHHANKLQWDYVEYLSRQLKDAKMQPNTAILNVLIDNKCRKGNFSAAWAIYQELTSTQVTNTSEGVFPDGETFRQLWKTLRLALSDPAHRDDPNLPEPRQLLKETVDWWLRCKSRYDADRFKRGMAAADGGAISALVLHCFSYKQDLPGALVALHVLREQFEIFPNHKVANIIQRQMSWVDMTRETDHVRQQYFTSHSHKGRAKLVAELFVRAAHGRMEWHQSEGLNVEELDDEEAGELNLNLLSEVIRSFLVLQTAPEIVEKEIEVAKLSSGLPRLETGDVTAWDVAPEEEDEEEMNQDGSQDGSIDINDRVR